MFGALSLTVSVPVRAPRRVGVKVTEMVQFAFAARVFGEEGQFEVAAKSPEVEIPVMVRGKVSLFSNVSVFPGLVAPTDWLPNASDDADKLAGIIPVPLNCVVCGEFEASSLTDNVPVRAPKAVGVKVTEIVQESVAANVAGDSGQLEVAPKSPDVEIPAMVKGTV